MTDPGAFGSMWTAYGEIDMNDTISGIGSTLWQAITDSRESAGWYVTSGQTFSTKWK